MERLGIEVSQRYLASADLVLFCREAGHAPLPAEEDFLRGLTVPVLVVETKVDLVARSAARPDAARVSALTGSGIPALRDQLAAMAFGGLGAGADLTPVLTRERHRIALAHARRELDAFQAARAHGLEAAVAATHLRSAVTALEGIIGVVASDDVLARVFATFCVGK